MSAKFKVDEILFSRTHNTKVSIFAVMDCAQNDVQIYLVKLLATPHIIKVEYEPLLSEYKKDNPQLIKVEGELLKEIETLGDFDKHKQFRKEQKQRVTRVASGVKSVVEKLISDGVAGEADLKSKLKTLIPDIKLGNYGKLIKKALSSKK